MNALEFLTLLGSVCVSIGVCSNFIARDVSQFRTRKTVVSATDTLRIRLFESALITVGLFLFMLCAAWVYPYRHKHFPYNVGYGDALFSLFALYACLVVLPVLFKGSMLQKLLAVAVS